MKDLEPIYSIHLPPVAPVRRRNWLQQWLRYWLGLDDSEWVLQQYINHLANIHVALRIDHDALDERVDALHRLLKLRLDQLDRQLNYYAHHNDGLKFTHRQYQEMLKHEEIARAARHR